MPGLPKLRVTDSTDNEGFNLFTQSRTYNSYPTGAQQPQAPHMNINTNLNKPPDRLTEPQPHPLQPPAHDTQSTWHDSSKQSLRGAVSDVDSVGLVHRSRIRQHENGYTEHRIPAHINGIYVTAFPDNCSALNIISEQFALHNKLPIDTSSQVMLRLPDHKVVSSIGSLNAVFTFACESNTFNVIFAVLRGCVYDLVLSGEFLWETQTFTTFKSRIQRSLSAFPPPSHRVCLQGTPHKQVYGSINGRIVSASPDTGSDVNVILRSCANFLGLKFDPDPNAMQFLEFIDGSCMRTCSIVRNAEWQFGMKPKTPPTISPSLVSHKSESPIKDWGYGSDATPNDIYICDFYVVEELTCPVILSSDLLYGTNAFTACAQHFYDNNKNSDNISFQKRKREEVDVAVVKRCSRTVKEVFKMTFGKSKSANLPSQVCPHRRTLALDAHLSIHGLHKRVRSRDLLGNLQCWSV